MFAVAVGANRRIGFTPGHELAVNPLPEIIFYVLMAFAAGKRDIKVVDRRLRKAGTEDPVSGPAG